MTEKQRYGAIDIGSNTVRMLVADYSEDGFEELYSRQIITRLGEGMSTTETLSDDAIERTLQALKELVGGAKEFAPFDISAVATHAVRSASNREKFETLFKETLGFPVTVISWEREASLSLKGLSSVINIDSPTLLFDIGGGSTEFIYKNQEGVVSSFGTNLGVVRLTEGFITQAPLIDDEYQKLTSYLKSEIKKVKEALKPKGKIMLVGTAGTVTSIAAIYLGLKEYEQEKINNTLIWIEDIKAIKENLGDMNLKERSAYNALKNGREDLIIAGLAIVICIMKEFGFLELTVSDAGLREGVLMALREESEQGLSL